MDCTYCQCGSTIIYVSGRGEVKEYTELDIIKDELEKHFSEQAERGAKFDVLMVSGNGEPTLYPFFREAVEYILKLKERYFQNKATGIFTNSLHTDPETMEAIKLLDERVFKLDAGDQETFERLNRPYPKVYLESVIRNLSGIGRVKLKTAVLDDNMDSLYGDGFINAMRIIKPAELQLFEVDRLNPDSPELMRVSEESIKGLATHIMKETGIITEVLYNKESRGRHDLLA